MPLHLTGLNSATSNDFSGLGIYKTYSTCALVSSAASATDIFTISGSATKTVAVTVFVISGVASTADVANMVVLKRSSVDTLGTPTVLTAVPSDSDNPPATAVVTSYAGTPTVGALVGDLRIFKLFLTSNAGNSGANSPSAPIIFAPVFSQPVTLRGTGETLAFNLGGVTISGGTFAISVEWVEF